MPRRPSHTARAAVLFVTVAAAPLVCGCSGELPPVSRVDKVRVLAVRAEPPEVRPGETSRLDTLTALPPLAPGEAEPRVTYLWLACIPPTGATAVRPCVLPSETATTLPPSCAADPSVTPCTIGESAALDYAPPAGLIDTGAPKAVKDVLVTVVVADEGAGGAVECAKKAVPRGGASPDPDHCVISVKRLTVSNAGDELRNHNPRFAVFTLDNADLVSGAAHFAVTEGGARLPLRVEITPQATDKNAAGEYESMFVSWFASAGALDTNRTSFRPGECVGECLKQAPPLAVETLWEQPDAEDAARYVKSGEVRFWAVVRDGDGGVAWIAGAARRR